MILTRAQIIDECVESLINTREMCGDEIEALKQVETNYEIKLTQPEKWVINQEVNKQWNEIQDDERSTAGVTVEKRLSKAGRRAAFADLED